MDSTRSFKSSGSQGGTEEASSNIRNSCNDNIFYKKKKLLKEEEYLCDRINDFYLKKKVHIQ